jgi:amino acid permease
MSSKCNSLLIKIFPVHNELEDNDIRNVKRVIGQSVGVSFCVYLLIGTVGLLTFGLSVSSNIIAQCEFEIYFRSS